jgi:hypothetical protein
MIFLAILVGAQDVPFSLKIHENFQGGGRNRAFAA